MVNFFYEIEGVSIDENLTRKWINDIIVSENKSEGEINFIFCNDEYLLKINQDFLNHDTYTDIISFDNSLGKEIHGEIYISYERVQENAFEFNESLDREMKRVIAHGILHFCGYKDKTDEEVTLMRLKEDEKITMFHVEHRKE